MLRHWTCTDHPPRRRTRADPPRAGTTIKHWCWGSGPADVTAAAFGKNPGHVGSPGPDRRPGARRMSASHAARTGDPEPARVDHLVAMMWRVGEDEAILGPSQRQRVGCRRRAGARRRTLRARYRRVRGWRGLIEVVASRPNAGAALRPGLGELESSRGSGAACPTSRAGSLPTLAAVGRHGRRGTAIGGTSPTRLSPSAASKRSRSSMAARSADRSSQASSVPPSTS